MALSPFDNAIAFALGAARRISKRAVRYGVGAKSIEGLEVSVGETRELIVNQEGLRIRIRQRDYFVAVSALVLDEEPILPDVGHVIFDTIDGAEKRFKVTKGDDGSECYRYSDEATRTEFRIHTEERS